MSELSTQALQSGDYQWEIEMYHAQTSSDLKSVFPTRVIIRNGHHPQKATMARTDKMEQPGWDEKYFVDLEYVTHESLNPFAIKSRDGAYLTVETGKLTWSDTKPAADAMWSFRPAGTSWSPGQIVALTIGIPIAAAAAVGTGVVAGTGAWEAAGSAGIDSIATPVGIISGTATAGITTWKEGRAIYNAVEPSKENIARVVVDKRW